MKSVIIGTLGRKPRPGALGIMMDTQRSLASMKEGEEGVLERLDLPDEMAQRLMMMGFLPGSQVRVTRRAPGGDPRVYRVDGSEIALRRETAIHLYLTTTSSEQP